MRIEEKYPWLEEYLLSKKGIVKDYKDEWEWHRFLLHDKMIAAFCGEESAEPLFTVKCQPDFNDFLRQTYPDIIEGYYMNKVHWNSVKINGNVPDEIVREMCDRAYDIILHSFSKKVQAEILGDEK